MVSTRAWRLVALCLIVALAGVVAVATVHTSRVSRGYNEFAQKLGQREFIEIKPAPIPGPWVISGSPVCESNVFGRSHDGSSTSGIWGCTGPAKFRWHYQGDETIYILEGLAEIEYLGKKFTLRAGDTTHFTDGTSAVWHVPERIRKTWRIYEVGRAAKLMRAFTR